MPCYEYNCWKCGEHFERIKPIRDRASDVCPECGSKVRVAVSVPTMQPDPYWSGHVDDTFGYVTSKKELRDKEARAGLRPSEPGDASDVKLARANIERKEDIVREKVIGETVRELCN
jgi:putative FmdB family regulatory protein